MNKTIHKYRLEQGNGEQVIPMPPGAECLAVGQQECALCLWVRLVPGAGREWRSIRVAGTGCEAPDRGRHVGTVVMTNGYVWHVFDMGVAEKAEKLKS